MKDISLIQRLKEIDEPTAIIIPGIFEVTEADRIEPGTEIARMRLYKKDV